jgi:Tol biopolymer transport system component
MMAADGRGKVRLTDGFSVNHAPVFGPDGRLFFTSNRSGHENIWSLMPSRQQADGERLTGETANDEEASKRPTAAAGVKDDL